MTLPQYGNALPKPSQHAAACGRGRRTYEAPVLRVFGSVSEITAGASTGPTDFPIEGYDFAE